MFSFQKYRILGMGISFMLLVSACGSSAAQQSAISTAVVQTVQAEKSLTEIASQPTMTPQVTLPVPVDTPLPAATPTNAPTTVAGSVDPNCAKASLVSEDPPDGVLLKPGETYWKTWTLLNTGTCTWNKSYSIIFWSGDPMGGLTSYPLDDEVSPNEQKDISIMLKAPETDGMFTGYWRLQSPWNANFGVGPADEPFYVKIQVSSAAEPEFGISNVTYNLVRDPQTGCPTNVLYTLYVTISTSGPLNFDYFWNQSDGNETGIKSLDFTKAESQTISREWMVGKGDSPNTRWIEFVVTDPEYREYGKATFENLCP